MIDDDDYSSAQGYGIFCWKKCVAKKQAQGIPPKRGGKGGKHDIAWQAIQDANIAAAAAANNDSDGDGGGKSKVPLIIGGLLVVAAIVTVVIIKTRK
tara:strand:- start:7870 stop:8160 length:291 start_codon:yes stop_codon:yes gene_type:complete